MSEDRPRRALKPADSVDEGVAGDKGEASRGGVAARLGTRIQRRRVSRNMTSEALAEAAGVSRQRLSVWENGKGMPDVFSLMQVARVLEVSMDWLVYGRPRNQSPPSQVAEYDAEKSDNIAASGEKSDSNETEDHDPQEAASQETATGHRGNATAYIRNVSQPRVPTATAYISTSERVPPGATAYIVTQEQIQEQIDHLRCRLEELERKQK